MRCAQAARTTRASRTHIGATVYLLLAGGDKSSQAGDIRRALAMVRALKE
jgi:putative component of toxin-antitoxin plasmid stabilization module